MILRDDQTRAVDKTRAAYQAGHRRVVLTMPTGAGKTVTSGEICRLALGKGQRILVVVPLVELIEQTVHKFQAVGITDIRTIQASNDNGNPNAKVIVASIQTLVTKRWTENPIPADFLIVDECHHGKARTHEQFLAQYQRAKILGLTATPQRGDQKALGDIYDALVVGSTVKELQDIGALVPCKVLAPPRIMDSRELAQDPVDAYEQYALGKKTIVFCSSIRQAEETAIRFRERGHKACWVSGDSPDRETIVDGFKQRAFDILVNVQLFVEGFDDPETEVAIMAKRFTAVGSWLQAIGRIIRPHPGKETALVIDLCGSALVHGTPDLEREYSLTGKGISSKREPIRQCQQCGGVFVSASAQACPFCAFKLPALTRAQAKALGLPLHEFDTHKKRTSWPMRAKRHSFCAGCLKAIVPGTWIVYSAVEKKGMHTSCAARLPRKEAA